MCAQPRCYIENCDEPNSEKNQYSPTWLNNTVPWGDDNTPDQCNSYNYTWANLYECQDSNAPVDEEMVKHCDEWVYDTSLFISTVVTDVSILYGERKLHTAIHDKSFKMSII